MDSISHLASDVLLDEMVLSLVVEDNVNLLRGSADIGTEHKVVRSLAVEVLQVRVSGHHLYNNQSITRSIKTSPSPTGNSSYRTLTYPPPQSIPCSCLTVYWITTVLPALEKSLSNLAARE